MSLTNAQYDEIVREYDRKQTENRHFVERRKAEMYSKDSRLAEIDKSIGSYALMQAERLLSGEQDAVADFKKQVQELQKDRKDILDNLGYSKDYLTPKYKCPDCKDTGYVNGKKCHCFKQAAIELVYAQSNIEHVLEKENFSQFTLDYYSKDQVNENGLTPYDAASIAYQKSKEFVETFDSEFRNLLFYGEAGVGKTFLSNCVAKALLDDGKSAIYFTATQLFDIFQKDVFEKDAAIKARAKEMRSNIYDCDLLVIDDLGTEFSNSFTSSEFYVLVNERILREKSTIISTNLTMNKIAELYTERTFSRITSNYTVLRLFGDDIRLVKKLMIK